MAGDSCTTNNDGQGQLLHKPLTTSEAMIDILATMPAKPQKRPVERIYASRQPRRPHYLAKLMERQNTERSELIESLGVDKGLLSRWLDDEKPSTPSSPWAAKLGEFFGKGHDPVDIFVDPDLDWLARFLQGRTEDELARARQMLEAAFPDRKVGSK
jgi:hypothetical protein